MKIQFLNGGLANQAFQYIFARYYELSHSGDVMYMDDSYFALNTVHNGYELERVFGIRPHMLSGCFDEKVWNFILDTRLREQKSVPQIFMENQIPIEMIAESAGTQHQFNPFQGKCYEIPVGQYLPDILDLYSIENLYYHGYWLNKNWFNTYRNIFLEEFQFPKIVDEQNLQYMKQITLSPSLSIHIRRGDYVALNFDFHTDFYQSCIDTFLSKYGSNWNLFVFSDDIPWCREHAEEMHFDTFQSVTFVEGNTHGENYRDLQLMSRCKAMIMSNSSFCFLAALLNTEREILINLTDRDI